MTELAAVSLLGAGAVLRMCGPLDGAPPGLLLQGCVQQVLLEDLQGCVEHRNVLRFAVGKVRRGRAGRSNPNPC